MKKSDLLKIIALLLIFGTGVWVSYYIVKPEPKLPIFSPADLIPEVVPDSLRGIGIDFRVGPFNLVDHTGNPFTEKDLNGKIYVTEFFFTTCPSICKDMSAQMRRIQATFAENDKIHLVSHTVMPEIDSVAVLADYAALQNAIPGKWHYLTGEKSEIYRMARTQYFAVRDGNFEGRGTAHDFIHTENFVLVDPRKRLRGFYDGTNKEDVDRLISDIRVLLNEFQ
jgi:protein SCO1